MRRIFLALIVVATALATAACANGGCSTCG